MTLRIAVTGSQGQLGRSLQRLLRQPHGRHRLVSAWSHGDLDVGASGAAERALDVLAEKPDVVVNAAAFTWVDRAETERDEATRVNAEGPGHLARACRARGIRLVHVSTDYVFEGSEGRLLREEDLPAPRSVYGATKLEGERRVLAADDRALVVRSSWLFGPGRNFVRTILDQAAARRLDRARQALRVVDDQFGSPTFTDHLAGGILALVEAGAVGVYHLANRGVATWWELAREALDRSGFSDLEIERVTTREFLRPAPRPIFSALDCRRAERLGVRLPAWREAVAAWLVSPESPLTSER